MYTQQAGPDAREGGAGGGGGVPIMPQNSGAFTCSAAGAER
jgi:hypothetical protein